MVMKSLNKQEFKAKTHNYRKELTYLKNGKHKSKQTLRSHTQKSNTQVQNNWRPSNHKKKRRET